MIPSEASGRTHGGIEVLNFAMEASSSLRRARHALTSSGSLDCARPEPSWYHTVFPELVRISSQPP